MLLVGLRRKLLVFLVVGIVSSISSGESVCFHYGTGITLSNCIVLHKVLNLKLAEMDKLFQSSFDIAYINGYGSVDGFWLTTDGSKKLDWCSLVNKVKAKVVVIDACYSGMVFYCNSTEDKLIITSTNAYSMSANLYAPQLHRWVSSLVFAIWCVVTGNCGDIPGCVYPVDMQVCQFGLIAKYNTWDTETLRVLYELKDLHPNVSVGTVMINGEPWR